MSGAAAKLQPQFIMDFARKCAANRQNRPLLTYFGGKLRHSGAFLLNMFQNMSHEVKYVVYLSIFYGGAHK